LLSPAGNHDRAHHRSRRPTRLLRTAHQSARDHLAAGTGRRSLATGVAAGFAVLGWLNNSFAPLVSALLGMS
jgi:hypothetical protein